MVFNAAKEIALDRFISNDIKFLDMSNLAEGFIIQKTVLFNCGKLKIK